MWCLWAGAREGARAVAAGAAAGARTRALSTTAAVCKKSGPGRGRARKSPKTLLRLYNEGRLRGAEAVTAASLLEQATAEKDAAAAAAAARTRAHARAPGREAPEASSLTEARHLIRAVEAARPRNAYELHIVTNVPPNQTNAFRGRIVYPREPRIKGEVVLVFADQGTDAAAAAQRAAEQLEASGSSTRLIIGGSEMISDAASNRVPPFTKVLCTTAILPALSRALARTLGPKGLMPSTKRGTAVEDGEEMQHAVEQLVTGVDWRGDRTGVVRGAVGRISFSESDLRSNVQALLDAVIAKAAGGLGGTRAPPSVVQGYARDAHATDAQGAPVSTRSAGSMRRALSIIKQVHLSSTQGPGVRLRLEDVL